MQKKTQTGPSSSRWGFDSENNLSKLIKKDNVHY